MRRGVLGAGVVGGLVLGGVAAWAWWPSGAVPAPEVDEEVRQRVQPAVHRAVVAEVRREMGAAEGERWFCAERIVEARAADGEGALRLSVVAECGAYERRGPGLVLDAGRRGPLDLRLTAHGDGAGDGPSYRVTAVRAAPDGAAYGPWLEREFSPGARAEAERLLHGDGSRWEPTAELHQQAGTAFRLPPEAEVTDD